MDIDAIAAHILATFPGTNPLRAGADHFFVHDPAPRPARQPHDPVGDAHHVRRPRRRLGPRPVRGVRLNTGLTREAAAGLGLSVDADPTALDVFLPHPVYGRQHWVCVLNPDGTWPQARDLLVVAHDLAVRRWTRWVERRA